MVVVVTEVLALRKATAGWLAGFDSVVASWLAGASVLATVAGACVAGGVVTVDGVTSGAVVVTSPFVASEPFPASVVSVPASVVAWPSEVTVDWLNASAYTVGDTDKRGEKAKKKARKAVNSFFIQILLIFLLLFISKNPPLQSKDSFLKCTTSLYWEPPQEIANQQL